MGLARNAIIAASQSRWLQEHAMRWRFVRKASRRFLPGERYEDALAAASELAAIGISSMLSRVGENITEAAEAEAVAEHYLTVIDAMKAAGLPASLSVKPTQLGLDLDAELCERNLERIIEAATTSSYRKGGFVWIDMESSAYVDRTLELYRRAAGRHSYVGVCLQSYLRRTAADVDSLAPNTAVIRLVKGAYREPESVAFPAKRDVDEAYFALAEKLLSAEALAADTRTAFATHDPKLIERIVQLAKARGQGRLGSRMDSKCFTGFVATCNVNLPRTGGP